jgi:hypothetical protein
MLRGDVALHWPLVDSPLYTRYLPRLTPLLLLLLPGHVLQGDVALHWPLVDSPGRLLQQLGQQELEAKRKEDGAAYLASLPGYRCTCNPHVGVACGSSSL